MRYQDPDDGWTFAHPYYSRVVLMAHAHRVEVGLSIPHDWEAWVELRICEATPSACYEVADAPVEPSGSSWTKKALQFGQAMFSWAAAGFPVTTWDQFKARLQQCEGDAELGIPRCPQYHVSKGGIGLTHCGACGCTKLKLFVFSERCPIGKWGEGTAIR